MGVAAFLYGAAHLVLWATAQPAAIAGSFTRADLLAGWIALAILLPLALTSNDLAVRRLGRRWKPLQRSAYAAGALAAVHWLLVEFHWRHVLTVILPVLLLEAWRFLVRPRLRGR